MGVLLPGRGEQRLGRPATCGNGRRGRRARLAAASLAAVGAVLLAACSSSGGSSPSGGSSSSGSLSGAAINIGSIQSASGSYGNPNWLKATSVWEKWTNAHGGINGHPVHVYAMDDGGNAAQGLSAAKELIQQKHVVAIVGANSSTPAWINYAAQAHVPVVGGATVAAATPNAYSYPASFSLSAMIPAAFEVSKSLGLTKYAQLFAQGSPVEQIKAALTQAAKASGIDFAYSTVVSPTQADYTAPCLGVKASKSDVVQVSILEAVNVNIISTCKRQGYTGAYMTVADLASPTWATNSALAGTRIYLLHAVWPLFLQDTPARKDYVDAIQQYAPGMLTSPGYDAGVQDAWAGMEMFRKAATLAGLGPKSTAGDVVNALNTITNETLGGLIGPITYRASDKPGHTGNCYFVSMLQNGKWTQPLGTQSRCIGS